MLIWTNRIPNNLW